MRTAFPIFIVPALSMTLAFSAGPAANPNMQPGSSAGTESMGSSAAVEANKAAFRALVEECVNKNNVSLADKYVAKDMVDHDPGNTMGGLEGFKNSIIAFRKAFPDARIEVQDIVGEGDRITARLRSTGTHMAAFNGVAPTNKKFDIMRFDEAIFRNGKAVEHWAVTDQLGMMKQLGVMPDGAPRAQPSSAPAGAKPAAPAAHKY
jgi:predicted ester cyclase